MSEIKGEVDHCRHRLMKYCQGQGLDLGCGLSKIKPDAIGIDLYHPEADMNMDARLLTQYSNESFDYIFSSHLLEELQDTEGVLREWFRVLKKGGNLVLYQIVEEEYYPIGDSRCNSRHKHHYTWEELWAMAQKIGDVELVHHADPVGNEWSFELVIQKKGGKVIVKVEDPIAISFPKSLERLPMFKIAVIAGPAQNYIQKCLTSIVAQDYKNWHCQVVIDPVDGSYELAKRYESEQIHIFRNSESKYALANIIKAFTLLNPMEDDVLITIDGDDWLASEKSFSILKNYYDNNTELLITHGSWAAYPNPSVPHNNRPYTEDDFKTGIRKVFWRASHLRTMKYKVWKYIKDEDFRDQSGVYYRSALDLSIMWPALEMAGYNRCKFIPEILYVYNQETPFSDDKLRLQEQMYFTNYIAAKKPYDYREIF